MSEEAKNDHAIDVALAFKNGTAGPADASTNGDVIIRLYDMLGRRNADYRDQEAALTATRAELEAMRKYCSDTSHSWADGHCRDCGKPQDPSVLIFLEQCRELHDLKAKLSALSAPDSEEVGEALDSDCAESRRIARRCQSAEARVKRLEESLNTVHGYHNESLTRESALKAKLDEAVNGLREVCRLDTGYAREVALRFLDKIAANGGKP